MDLVLFKNFSTENTLGKNVTSIGAYPGEQMLDVIDDADIRVRMQVDHKLVRWDACNYFYWDGAFYYLDSVEYESAQVTILNGRMDPLETYIDTIRNLRVLPERTTSHSDGRIRDQDALVSVSRDRSVLMFPQEISGAEEAGVYVLVTAQKGYDDSGQ